MKSVVKAIIAGSVIICIGVVVILVAVGISDGKLSFNTQWEKQEYECVYDIDVLKVDFKAGTLNIQFYNGDNVKVRYYESDIFTTNCSVSGNKLTVQTDKIAWKPALWFGNIPTTTLFIPKRMSVDLQLDVAAGSVTVEDGYLSNVDINISAGAIEIKNVHCDKFDIEMSAGSTTIQSLVCNTFVSEISAGSVNVARLTSDKIYVDLSAGSTNISVVGDKADYKIRTDVSAGRCNLSDQAGNYSYKTITVDVSAGSVNIKFVK